jgi:hypothetical protein
MDPTPNQKARRRRHLASLKTLEEIQKNPSYITDLFLYIMGVQIIRDCNTAVVNHIEYHSIPGYTTERLIKEEADYHRKQLEHIPPYLQCPQPYHVTEIPNIIPHDLCDELIRRAAPHLTITNMCGDGPAPVSRSASIQNSTTFKFKKIISDLLQVSSENFNEVQVKKYDQGGEFSDHFDSDPSQRCRNMWSYVVSIVTYLNDDYKGGETEFPLLNQKIKPEKGKILLFWVSRWTDQGITQIPESIHRGNPVESGEKWIANLFVSSRTFIPARRVTNKLIEEE